MPMIPQDMDKCREKTRKERAQMRVTQKDYRRKQRALNREIEELKRAHPDMDVFLCTRT